MYIYICMYIYIIYIYIDCATVVDYEHGPRLITHKHRGLPKQNSHGWKRNPSLEQFSITLCAPSDGE